MAQEYGATQLADGKISKSDKNKSKKEKQWQLAGVTEVSRGRRSRVAVTINQTQKEGRGLYGGAPPIY